jgi:pimeloyl-ACP methyl ester carboxylesterase
MKRIGVLGALTFALACPVSAAAATTTLERADGSAIVYHLSGQHSQRSKGVLLLLQGSGCEPVAGDAKVLSASPLLAPSHAVLTIEKYGVTPGRRAPDEVEGCSGAYWRGSTLQQRVLDALQVVARLRRERWWNGDLVIFGGSEGGAVAALLAPLVPETRAVVIRSSGIGVPVGELIKAAVPPPIARQVDAVLAAARANPTGDKRFGGASYRWWADAADIVPARALLQTDIPVLLIQGSRDQFAPVATARATRDLFASAGKQNLTYREYAGYDHFMRDAGGEDHQAAVLKMAADWLAKQNKRTPPKPN